jgi:hypothetical protein
MLESRRYRRDRNQLAATPRRSCQEAQDAFTTAHDSAVQVVYGKGDRETFEKRGDHRIAKRDPDAERLQAKAQEARQCAAQKECGL